MALNGFNQNNGGDWSEKEIDSVVKIDLKSINYLPLHLMIFDYVL